LVDPLKNQISSWTTALKASRFVVTAGKPWLKSKRICLPKTLSASTFSPVDGKTALVGLRKPFARTSSNKSRYSLIRPLNPLILTRTILAGFLDRFFAKSTSCHRLADADSLTRFQGFEISNSAAKKPPEETPLGISSGEFPSIDRELKFNPTI
jgi:hypothetical protein